MSIKKIIIAFSTKSKSKLETPMFNIIEKFLKSFFRQANHLSRRDQAENSRSATLAVALISQTALIVWILVWVLDKAK